MCDARAIKKRLVLFLLALATVAASLAVAFRFRLEPNVASLLPDAGEAASLLRYVRGFGGGDLAVFLVEGEDPEEVALAASRLARDLREKPTVRRAADRIETEGGERVLDPMLVFRHADAAARARLLEVLEPEGMRARLRETRALLLAPGGGAQAERVARDPLRLGQLVFERAGEGEGGVGSGVRTQPDGAFATDDGRAALVLVQPRGESLRGEDARAFVRDAEAAMAEATRAHPGVRVGLTGGHAIAAATEAMLTRDLARSSTLALVLASIVFALLFRRMRALLAVLPPLLLGTLWTAGIASALPGGVSGIAVAFMSVVVGVGVDTGVHVYAALLEARREGLPPDEAARRARARTARSVLTAAGTAALAFAALSLSEIRALRQLGLLCAAGEVLTALAIVAVTPVLGARLERGAPPGPPPAPYVRPFVWASRTKIRAALALAFALAPAAALALLGPPSPGEAIVAIRPAGLEPLSVQAEVFERFGGRRGQYVVLVGDRDLSRARERADRVAERLASMPEHVEAVDALTALAPSPSTQRERLAARDALDLPGKADELERVLVETGFAPARFEEALASMRAPSAELVRLEDLERGGAGILVSRYLGEDEGERLVAIYVRPRGEGEGAAPHVNAILAAVAEVDPAAALTGYARLETALRDSLARDLPKIGGAAALLVALALLGALRRPAEVLAAALVVVAELALVLVCVRIFEIPLHAYDALVLPVLLGITVDEAMFLLERSRASVPPGVDPIAAALREEGPPISATALTTAAGFGALAFCEFDGLRDLGRLGALGSSAGLVVALLTIPACLRLSRNLTPSPSPSRERGAKGLSSPLSREGEGVGGEVRDGEGDRG